MLIVDTGDTITLELSAAVDVDVLVSYVDNDAGVFSPDREAFVLSTADDHVIVPAPSGVRNVKRVAVRNTHASTPVTVTLRHVGDATVVLYERTLAAGAGFTYDEFEGWRPDSLAPTKTVLAGSGTYLTPPGCTMLELRLIAAGGGGGAVATGSGSAGSSGGGGGAAAIKRVVNPGPSYAYVVGQAADAPAAGNNPGVIGGATCVGDPLVIEDVEFTAEADDDLLTIVGHGMLTGDGPVRVANAGGGLPTGLAAATDYWVIREGDDNLKLATSLSNALNGTAINITTDGTGTQTLSDTADTMRPIAAAVGGGPGSSDTATGAHWAGGAGAGGQATACIGDEAYSGAPGQIGNALNSTNSLGGMGGAAALGGGGGAGVRSANLTGNGGGFPGGGGGGSTIVSSGASRPGTAGAHGTIEVVEHYR